MRITSLARLVASAATAAGTYQIEVRHDGLHKYRLIKGKICHVVEQKAQAQMVLWEEMWRKRLEAEAKRAERERQTLDVQEKKDLAAERTQEAEEAIAGIEDLLAHTLNVDDMVDWDSLRDHSPFPEPPPDRPESVSVYAKPEYRPPEQGLLDTLFRSIRERNIRQAEAKYESELRSWQQSAAEAEKINREQQAQYKVDLQAWETEKEAFLREQEEANGAVDRQMAAYAIGEPGAVLDYCDLVLSRSEYPEMFPQDYELDYRPETKILIVEYKLPSPDDLPTVKEVKYIQTRDEFNEVALTDSARNKLYDSAIYQVALRTMHELFEADSIRALDAIVFNGWVTSIDRSTGQEATSCILSLQAGREEFLAINLSQVNPKACFRKLKGVGSSKLHSLAAVPPILEINREDKRFVSSYDVADELDESYNLAAMDWQDFEHLIRELFEKEFTQGGGEVKVTRASRDGGVDAIAFDPDPLRGGKIVIQAKRYTNVVGVSAVRDLYGTVVNEGAIKGILVTTAEYGPDAYQFAKDKPLTLLNGSNLLSLLEKHGHKAKIDLKAARRILAEREKQS